MKTQELAKSFGEILKESLNEIYILDAESYKFLQVNKGARLNLGYTSDEFLDLDSIDINPDLTPDFFGKVEPLISGDRKKIRARSRG
jgi:hypothetical protein